MDNLDSLANRSIYIIREAYAIHREKLAILSSFGKDSMNMLYLTKKAFLGEIPMSVIFIDTGSHFKELINFRDFIHDDWNLELFIAKNKGKSVFGHQDKVSCCTFNKTEALKDLIARHGFEALMLGIRRDEHGIRSKERVFSPRHEDFTWDYLNQSPELWDNYSPKTSHHHIRIHPLLHWTEIEEWEYIQREKIPHVGMYYAKDGKRYRSIGCESCTDPVPSNATTIEEIIEEIRAEKGTERIGRAQDKESLSAMEKLRALGYC